MEIEAKPASHKIDAAGLSILIVDDEDATRELCRDIALEMGLEVHTASTTSEALDRLEEIVDERRRLRRQEQYYSALHAWLYAHIGLAVLSLMLVAPHMLFSLFF